MIQAVRLTKAEAETGLNRAARLRQAILKRAFEGRLVPQDPNDEPANVLLERIWAEREAAGAASGNGRPRRGARRQQQATPNSTEGQDAGTD